MSKKWKLNEQKDADELKRLIKYQLVMELWKMEDRKNVKRIERERFFRELDESSEDDVADDNATDKTNMSPKRGKGYDN